MFCMAILFFLFMFICSNSIISQVTLGKAFKSAFFVFYTKMYMSGPTDCTYLNTYQT